MRLKIYYLKFPGWLLLHDKALSHLLQTPPKKKKKKKQAENTVSRQPLEINQTENIKNEFKGVTYLGKVQQVQRQQQQKVGLQLSAHCHSVCDFSPMR